MLLHRPLDHRGFRAVPVVCLVTRHNLRAVESAVLLLGPDDRVERVSTCFGTVTFSTTVPDPAPTPDSEHLALIVDQFHINAAWTLVNPSCSDQTCAKYVFLGANDWYAQAQVR